MNNGIPIAVDQVRSGIDGVGRLIRVELGGCETQIFAHLGRDGVHLESGCCT